jgi:hypothetical protein
VFVLEPPRWVVIQRPGRPNYRIPLADMEHFTEFLTALNASNIDNLSIDN